MWDLGHVDLAVAAIVPIVAIVPLPVLPRKLIFTLRLLFRADCLALWWPQLTLNSLPLRAHSQPRSLVVRLTSYIIFTD